MSCMQERLLAKMRTHHDNILAREDHGNNRSAKDVVHKAWVEWLALEVNVVLLCKRSLHLLQLEAPATSAEKGFIRQP